MKATEEQKISASDGIQLLLIFQHIFAVTKQSMKQKKLKEKKKEERFEEDLLFAFAEGFVEDVWVLLDLPYSDHVFASRFSFRWSFVFLPFLGVRATRLQVIKFVQLESLTSQTGPHSTGFFFLIICYKKIKLYIYVILNFEWKIKTKESTFYQAKTSRIFFFFTLLIMFLCFIMSYFVRYLSIR